MTNDSDNQILIKKKKKDNKRKRFNNEDLNSDNEFKISVNEEMKVKKRKKHKDGTSTKRSRSDEGNKFISAGLESTTSRKEDSIERKKFKHVKRSEEKIDVEEEPTSGEHHVLKKKKKNKLISNNEGDFSSGNESVVVNKEIKAKKKKKHEHKSPNQKSKKHKGSQNVAEDEEFVSTNPESSTIGQDKKRTKMSYIPNQVLDALLLKCDKIVEDSKSSTVKHDLNKHKRVVSKSVKGSHIPNEVLDYLLLKCDKIVEEDENKKASIKENQHSVKRNEEISQRQEFSQEMESKDEEELNDDAEKLQKIQFVLPFGLPAIHKIAYLPCTRPTPEQRTDLENAGIELKLGKFTKEEDEKILKNWKQFCQTHDWDEKNYMPFLKGTKKSKKGILTKKKVEKFVQFISHNFEDRLMYYIYLRFQRLFSINEDKKFTPEEDEMIRSYVKNMKRPYAELSFLLKRSRDALQKRYKRLQIQTGSDNVKIFWNKDRTKQLIMSIMKVTGCKNVEDLKIREITEEEWKKISKKMALPEQKIKGVWLREVYSRIFNPNFGEKSAEILEKLINKMSKKYNDWRDIDWHEEAKEYDSFTHQRLYKMFADLVRTKVPKEEQKDFKACIKYLKQSSIEPKKLRFTYIQEILGEIEEEHKI